MWNYKYLRITPVIAQDRYHHKQLVIFKLPGSGYRSGRIKYVNSLAGYMLLYDIIPSDMDEENISRIHHSYIIGTYDDHVEI